MRQPRSHCRARVLIHRQLHIIENRYRLERQIFLGRQAVRKAMRTRLQARTDQTQETEPQGRLPMPVADTRLSAPPMNQSLSGETPLPVDSEAEAAYANGTARPRLHRRHLSARSTASAQDLRARRRWSAVRVTEGDSGDDIPNVDYGRATPDPPPDNDPGQTSPAVVHSPMLHTHPAPPSPSALFRRLRTASFSPFSTMRRGSRIFGKEEPPVQAAQPGATPASSESSSDDDDLSVLSRRLMNRSNRESTDEDDEYDANAA